jgi:serine phosphatase RsbU (regulator of sigma subunit)
LLACLIIPWTTRESLLSALSILAVYITLLVLDAAFGWIKAPAIAVFGITAAVMFISPSVICWWRYSSWRQRLSLTLENRRFRSLYQELTAARRIHEAILPKPQPDKPLAFSYAYEPAREIGGDLLFVDPSPHPRGHLRLLVLDVTGHGIAAALTVNRIVGEVQRVLAEAPGASPGRLLSALNHYACLTLSQHQIYASALCIEISAGGLTYASAGHPTAFVVSPAAGGRPAAVRELESTTFLLGCVPPDDFDSSMRSVELGMDDVVVAYTDGASESTNPAGQQLLTAGFAEMVRSMVAGGVQPQNLSQRLQEAVARHRAAPAQDDMLIVTAWQTPSFASQRMQPAGILLDKLPD